MTVITEDRPVITAETPAPAGPRMKKKDASLLRHAKQGLVKAGNNSVRAAWRFGQALDSFSDRYIQAELARAVGLSTGTVYKYRRLYGLYQRPELAVAASEELETFDVGLLISLAARRVPVEHGRPLAGRHYAYVCHHCSSRDVGRIEVDAEGNEIGPDEAEGTA